MTQEEFNVVFELQMRKCADILAHKKKEYTGDNIDRLSAFKIAAALQNCNPKAALAGMMSKHVVWTYCIIWLNSKAHGMLCFIFTPCNF